MIAERIAHQRWDERAEQRSGDTGEKAAQAHERAREIGLARRIGEIGCVLQHVHDGDARRRAETASIAGRN